MEIITENQHQSERLYKLEKNDVFVFLNFVFQLLVLYVIGMGVMTYLISIIVTEILDKITKKINSDDNLKFKRTVLIVLGFYFYEQYLILNNSNIVYWSIVSISLGVCTIYYFLIFLKFKIKNKVTWASIFVLIIFLLYLSGLYGDNLIIEKIISIKTLLIIGFSLSLIIFILMFFRVIGSIPNVSVELPEILSFRIYIFVIYSFFFSSDTAIIRSIKLRRTLYVIIILIMMILLKKLYSELNKFRVVSLEDRLQYIVSIILGIYFTIEVFSTIIINY